MGKVHSGMYFRALSSPITKKFTGSKDFAGKTCQFIRGDGIDAAVAQLLLAAIEPAQLTIALEAVEHLEAQAQAIDRQWQLRLERARYEADRARRRYLEVEPLCSAQCYVA
jgi:hypothetical protein